MPVPAEAWIGSISAYSESTLDEQYLPVTEERKFAAFIAGDRLHPSRNGGDAYYRIPRNAGAAGKLASIRNSRSKATDLSGGVSVLGLGGDFSSCKGESWAYRALLDLNGDRYPDAVRLADDAGSTSLRVSPGTGQGFAPEQAYSSSFSSLGRYENKSLGFGASLGSSSGATKLQYLASGKVYRTTVQEAKAEFGVSLGVNGTLASAIQTEGLLDLNGDGLPDHLSRSGSGDFLAALNTGEAAFASPVSWGAGITLNLFGGLDGLPGHSQGLSHSSTGSFGASAGFSVDAGLIGAGASAGFSGTVSHNYTTLADVNGDGLADQVAKQKNEGFFRVRFNQGDCFCGKRDAPVPPRLGLRRRRSAAGDDRRGPELPVRGARRPFAAGRVPHPRVRRAAGFQPEPLPGPGGSFQRPRCAGLHRRGQLQPGSQPHLQRHPRSLRGPDSYSWRQWEYRYRLHHPAFRGHRRGRPARPRGQAAGRGFPAGQAERGRQGRPAQDHPSAPGRDLGAGLRARRQHRGSATVPVGDERSDPG